MDVIDFNLLFDNTDKSSIGAYGLAIGVSIILAGLLDILYRYYFLRDGRGIQVNRAFILIAPAVTAIFLVIQFSLPLSLGLLGALSFVRFRTPIKEPEEIGFILVVIANSLACAVFKFEVALLLIAFSVLACLLKQYGLFSGWFMKKGRVELFVTGQPNTNSNPTEVLTTLITNSGYKAELVSIAVVEGETSYHLKLKADLGAPQVSTLSESLNDVGWVKTVNVLINS